MRGVIAVGRAVVDLVRDEEVTFLAAAIAYYAFVSLLPALLLALVVASVAGGDQLATRVLDAGGAYLTSAGRGVVEESLTSARGRSGATAIGIVLLGWTTLRVFRGLDIAFSRVYGTRTRSFAGQVGSAAVVVFSIGVGIGAMIVVGAVLAAIDLPVGGRVLGLALLLVSLVVVFLPAYYVFPSRSVTIREALPGAAIAAVGWVILQALFQIYASVAGTYDLYGVIGGVLLLVTWFYAAAIVVLVGAAANVVLADSGDGGNR